MAISIDSANAGTNGDSGTTITWNHVVASGATMLVVQVACDDAQPSGVTYNGTAMTLGKHQASSGGDSASVWYLASPTAGTLAIVVTKGNGSRCRGSSVSLLGSATTIGATNGANNTGTAVSTPVTTTGAGNGIVLDAVWSNAQAGGDMTVGADQTIVSNGVMAAGSTRHGGMSYETFASGADVTMSWTIPNSVTWTQAAIEVDEAAAATGFKNLLLMGVG